MRLLFAGLVVLAGPACAQTVVDGSDEALPADIVTAAVTAVSADLYDPLSAQISRLSYSETKPGTVCGFLNAKNRMGGFTGFMPFAVSETEVVHFDLEKGDPRYEIEWLRFFSTGCPDK